MQTINEKTIIKSPPEKVWEFLTTLHKGDNYHQWHPHDHIIYRLKKGDMQTIGSKAYFEERIGTFKLKLTYQLTKAQYPSYLEYSPAFPLSLLNLGKASFALKSIEANATELTAYVRYGYGLPIMGGLIDFLIRMFVKKADAEKHIREEGENLKRLLD